jgi:hypothetical protein
MRGRRGGGGFPVLNMLDREVSNVPWAPPTYPRRSLSLLSPLWDHPQTR